MTTISIPPALARRRNYAGPALFSYGFRPFFLGGAIWAALSVLLWLPLYLGEVALPTAMTPIDWHVHEMLYGYVPAVVAGFLLTAIPNWTGRLPVNGVPLAALAALWLAGRIAVFFSAGIGAWTAAAVDLAFLLCLGGLALREIVAGKNWRNLRVLAVLSVLFVGNVVFHYEAIADGHAIDGTRIGLGAVLTLIMLIGGRIVPSFTHNWINRANPGRLPKSFSRFDAVCLAVAVIAFAGWVLAPEHALAGALLMLAGILHAARLARWAGDRTLSDRLVFILHVAYAFVPLGFLLVGSSILWPDAVPASAGIHAWTAGAIGTMTLAVMTRASLGHTGQPLAASAGTQAIYAFVVIAALARVFASWGFTLELLHVAALSWAAAFAGFALLYGPPLLRVRR
ncbi:MAG: NnrS family protein [Bradyrhizobiaceae bacterium]|nr:NnrS family protein [Bradyrhizobiaceae bacterium]